MSQTIYDKLKAEIDELVEEGEALCRECSDFSQLSMWHTRAGQMIRNLCTEDSQYFRTFEEHQKTLYSPHKNPTIALKSMVGAIKAVQIDYSRGLLLDIRQLLQAEIFVDFLEMGEYLLSGGYKDAAAVIIGSVLEDALRKLAIANEIDILTDKGTHKTIEPLNQDLARAEVYNKLTQKQVTVQADIRNNAAHGNYDKYNKQEVKMMLMFVQKFCSDYLK